MSEDEMIIKLACERIKTNLKRIAEINLQLAEIDQKEEEKFIKKLVYEGINASLKRMGYYDDEIKEMSEVKTKICSKCKKGFPATSKYFYRNKNSKNGLYSRCKNCFRQYWNQYYQAHKEKYISYKIPYYQKKYPQVWQYLEENPSISNRKLGLEFPEYNTVTLNFILVYFRKNLIQNYKKSKS